MPLLVIVAPPDLAAGMEKENATGAANTHGKSEEHILTFQSIADFLENVNFGELERLKALRSMVASMEIEGIASRDILRAVEAYLREVLGQ